MDAGKSPTPLPRVEQAQSATDFWLVSVRCTVGRGMRIIDDHVVLAASLGNAYDYRDKIYNKIWDGQGGWACSVYYLDTSWTGSQPYDPLYTRITTDARGCGEGESTDIIITPVNEVV
jgi:hypothetical protein